MKRIRLLMCDHQPLIRSGLRLMLEQTPEIEVLAETGEREVVSLARRVRPDVVLTDIDLPVDRGIKIVRLLSHPPSGSPVPVMVLTMRQEDEHIFAALRAGARGFLLKGGTLEELHMGITAVAHGQAMIAPAIAGRILDRVAPHLPDYSDECRRLVRELTPREHEVLRLLAKGWSNLSIARRLGLSQATVRSHVHHVLIKLRLGDRAQAVAYVYRIGLFSPVVDAAP
jgi:DNA-binding NarL/FixJ family response regulator